MVINLKLLFVHESSYVPVVPVTCNLLYRSHQAASEHILLEIPSLFPASLGGEGIGVGKHCFENTHQVQKVGDKCLVLLNTGIVLQPSLQSQIEGI